MLRDLYLYAVAHPDVIMPSGFSEGSVDLVVCVDQNGSIVDISDVRDNGKGHKFVRPVRNGAKNDDPFVRKAEIFISGANAKLQSLVGEFESCDDILFNGIRSLLCSNLQGLLDAINYKFRDLFGADLSMLACSKDKKDQAKLKLNIGFSVLDANRVEIYAWDVPGVKKWWNDLYRSENASSRSCIDILTGEPCVASKLIKNTSLKAAAGGQTSGSNLISFNVSSFESYGFEQGANLPAGMESVSMAIDAYNHLAINGVRLADMRLICWCSGLDSDIESDFRDVFQFDFGSADKTMSQDDIDAAGRRIRDILSAPLDADKYGSLEKGTYHVMLTKADAARISVLFYDTGDCVSLLRHYRNWYDGMRVADLTGRNILKQRNAYGLIFAAVSIRDRKASDMFAKHRKFVKPIVQACMQGRPLPDDLLYMAVRAFQSAFHPAGDDKVNLASFGSTVQLIQLCLTIGKEGSTMPDNNKSDAYLCGCLFAVHEWFYGVATRNSDAMTEKFVACCQKPAAQIKKIQMLCAHRMRDVHWFVAKKLFKSECEAIFGSLNAVPAGLDVRQQAEFILGYWHEQGHISCEIEKAKTGSTNNNMNQEDDSND